MFGWLSSAGRIAELVQYAAQSIAKAYRKHQADKRRDAIRADPAAEFQRRYGGLHPKGNDDASASRTRERDSDR